jgi:hypothetical protein
LSENFVGEGAAKKNMCVRCVKFFSTKREAVEMGASAAGSSL